MLTSWMVLIFIVLIHWGQAAKYGTKADVRYVIPIKMGNDTRFRTGVFTRNNFIITALRNKELITEEKVIARGEETHIMEATIFYGDTADENLAKTMTLAVDVVVDLKAIFALFVHKPTIERLEGNSLQRLPDHGTFDEDYIAIRLYGFRLRQRNANSRKRKPARTEFYYLYDDCHTTVNDKVNDTNITVIQCTDYEKDSKLDYGAPVMGVKEDRSHKFLGIVINVYRKIKENKSKFFVKSMASELEKLSDMFLRRRGFYPTGLSDQVAIGDTGSKLSGKDEIERPNKKLTVEKDKTDIENKTRKSASPEPIPVRRNRKDRPVFEPFLFGVVLGILGVVGIVISVLLGLYLLNVDIK